MKQNRFFEAAYYYSKALEQKDATGNILQPIAFSLANIGELEAAKNYYLLSLNFHQEDESAKKELATLTAFLNQVPDPDAQIRQMLDDHPDDPALLLKQGDLYNRQGLSEKALAAYQKAEGIAGEEDEILRRALLSRLAKLFSLTRHYEAASKAYLKLIRMSPENALLYYNSAAVYAVSGNIPKAKELLKKAEEKGLNVTEKIKTDPNFEGLTKPEEKK
ncbi:MAG: tetratricopeptide repeat protein [Desulfosalsimonadaceae bacterium]